ncbi:hypothetical protein SISSUDRAFT_1047505 [Sistotremastrum suecicum HHB10207 ss-3]|uniref:Uncharacterized protein n=1 Tax=Sistotremastrum suecicum HHB10207 ss-3 TaxID=1314776 RepID=A0A166D4W2_9AGAM|nr:hypothetical protein SISSUDRAFT_1047505 [Sistotremastrum suecicum HHB10207 ss-3]
MSPTDTRISSASSYALPFHRMTRLRSLTVWFLPFSRHGKAEEVKFFKKLNQTLIPNTLHQFWTLTVMPAQDIRFLRRQNQLRRLTTSKLPEDCIKDPSFLPQLEDLELKGDEIEQSLWLLQTRALRALSVTFRHAHLKQQFHGNSLVLLDMKFESVSQSSWISFLHLRAVDCPNVVCLFLQLDMGEDEEPLPAFDRAGNVDWFSPVIQALERWQQMQVLQLKAVTTTPPNHVVSAFKTNCRTPRLRDVLLQVSDEEDTEKNYELRRNVDRGWDVAESEQTDVLNWMNGSRSTVVQEPLVLTK